MNPHTLVSTLFVFKKFFYDSNKLTKTKSKQHIILKTDKKQWCVCHRSDRSEHVNQNDQCCKNQLVDPFKC